MSSTYWNIRILLVLVLFVAACGAAPKESGPRIVGAGAPGESGRVLEDGAFAAVPQHRFAAADVRFMQMMIVHHKQALEMAGLVPDRSAREDVRLLARRIEESQADEIAQMRRWLESHGEPVTNPHAPHETEARHLNMHGMITDEELRRLTAASGAEFDRLFLEFMVRHHEGALIMVEELFSIDGAGQDPEIFDFASHVQADQRIEITRMRRMLGAGH